jgi:Zn-dependent peptidase ImmA (M78 family)
LIIEVNSLFPLVRRRLSIAHEIGHLIVDRCSSEPNAYWGHEDPAIEALCNRLAGQLLAPDWALEEYFESEYGLADWRKKVRCSTIIGTACRFGISVDAVASRIF